MKCEGKPSPSIMFSPGPSQELPSRMHAAQAHLSPLLGRLLKTWESRKRSTPPLLTWSSWLCVIITLHPLSSSLLAGGQVQAIFTLQNGWYMGVREPHTYSFLFLKRSLDPKQKKGARCLFHIIIFKKRATLAQSLFRS